MCCTAQFGCQTTSSLWCPLLQTLRTHATRDMCYHNPICRLTLHAMDEAFPPPLSCLVSAQVAMFKPMPCSTLCGSLSPPGEVLVARRRWIHWSIRRAGRGSWWAPALLKLQRTDDTQRHRSWSYTTCHLLEWKLELAALLWVDGICANDNAILIESQLRA